MTKAELVELLAELKIPISECTPQDDDMEAERRVCFWDYIWEDVVASDSNYNTNVTYQISFVANRPRDSKLLELKNKLNSKGIFPVIQHEYIVEKKRVHSFFSIEVLENIGAVNE